MFDAVSAARARGIDVVIADTAGRLPTQLHLMEEIRKVKRVIAKAHADAPHEVLLVLDANTGQNALAQVKAFDEALGLTGLVVTKLDGTAKGGVVCARSRAQRPGAGLLHRRGREASTTCGPSSRASSPRRWLVSFSAVAKRYPGGQEALRDVSFSVEAGELVVHHRPLGRRQVDAAQADPGHRAPDRRLGDRQRAERRRAQARRDSVPAAQPRPRLPGPEAALRPHRSTTT